MANSVETSSHFNQQQQHQPAAFITSMGTKETTEQPEKRQLAAKRETKTKITTRTTKLSPHSNPRGTTSRRTPLYPRTILDKKALLDALENAGIDNVVKPIHIIGQALHRQHCPPLP